MALRCMTHVLYRQSSVNFIKKYQAGIRSVSSNSIKLVSIRSNTMATQYIPVEKGTPNSPNYRVYYSKYWQCSVTIFFFISFIQSSRPQYIIYQNPIEKNRIELSTTWKYYIRTFRICVQKKNRSYQTTTTVYLFPISQWPYTYIHKQRSRELK